MKLGFRTHKMGANIEGLDLVLAECVEDFQEQDYEKWFTEDRRLLSGFLLQVIRDLVLSKGNVKRGAEAVMKIFLDKTEV